MWKYSTSLLVKIEGIMTQLFTEGIQMNVRKYTVELQKTEKHIVG